MAQLNVTIISSLDLANVDWLTGGHSVQHLVQHLLHWLYTTVPQPVTQLCKSVHVCPPMGRNLCLIFDLNSPVFHVSHCVKMAFGRHTVHALLMSTIHAACLYVVSKLDSVVVVKSMLICASSHDFSLLHCAQQHVNQVEFISCCVLEF